MQSISKLISVKALFYLLNILMLVLLSACHSGHSEHAKVSVNFLGAYPADDRVNSTMRDTFDVSDIDSTDSESAADEEHQALFLAGNGIDDIISDDTNKVLMKSFLDNNKPVTMVTATADQVKKLGDFLGVSNINLSHSDSNWFAVYNDKEGNPQLGTVHRTQIIVADDEDTNDDITNVYTVTTDYSALNDKLAQKVISLSQDALVDYVKSPVPANYAAENAANPTQINTSMLAKYANTGELDQKAQAALLSVNDESDVYDLDSLEDSTYTQSINDVIYSSSSLESCDDEEGTCDYSDYARYTYTIYVWSFYNADATGTENTDYHFAVLYGDFAQSEAYTEDKDSERAYFAITYGLSAVLTTTDQNCGDVWSEQDSYNYLVNICEDSDACSDVLSESTGLSLLASSPDTETECTVTSYTSSVDYDISGTMYSAFSGISGGVDIGESESTTTEDVCVYNYSGETDYNEAAFLDAINAPSDKKSGSCYVKIYSPSGSATATYSPYKMFLWATTSDVRDTANDEGDGYLRLCTAMSYAWEKIELEEKNQCIGINTYYKKKKTHHYSGYTYYYMDFPLGQTSDTDQEAVALTSADNSDLK